MAGDAFSVATSPENPIAWAKLAADLGKLFGLFGSSSPMVAAEGGSGLWADGVVRRQPSVSFGGGDVTAVQTLGDQLASTFKSVLDSLGGSVTRLINFNVGSNAGAGLNAQLYFNDHTWDYNGGQPITDVGTFKAQAIYAALQNSNLPAGIGFPDAPTALDAQTIYDRVNAAIASLHPPAPPAPDLSTWVDNFPAPTLPAVPVADATSGTGLSAPSIPSTSMPPNSAGTSTTSSSGSGGGGGSLAGGSTVVSAPIAAAAAATGLPSWALILLAIAGAYWLYKRA